MPDIWITEKRMDGHQNEILFLIPRRVTLGMGCRKGAGKDAILNTAEKLCLQAGIDKRSIGTIASIDLKCEEEGLAEAARELNAGLVFFFCRRAGRGSGVFFRIGVCKEGYRSGERMRTGSPFRSGRK